MIQKELPLSEPECSDCSSYEELSSISESEVEEVILFDKTGDNDSNKSGSSSNTTNYRSWYSSRRRGSKVSNNLSDIAGGTNSKDSLTVITESQKNWWYWMKLAVFIATPFIARQVGIMVGKRILSKTFKTAAA